MSNDSHSSIELDDQHTDPGDEYPLVIRIVERVAERSDTDPTSLPPMAATIDTDALGELFDRGRRADASDVELSFVYAGYRVHVSSDDISLQSVAAA